MKTVCPLGYNYSFLWQLMHLGIIHLSCAQVHDLPGCHEELVVITRRVHFLYICMYIYVYIYICIYMYIHILYMIFNILLRFFDLRLKFKVSLM